MRVGIIGNFEKEHYQAAQVEKLLNKSKVNTIRLLNVNSIPNSRIYVRILREAMRQIRKCDVVYGISCGLLGRKLIVLWFLSKLLGKFTVNHWIGTDVLDVISVRKCKLLAKLNQLFIDYNLSSAQWLRDELRSINIESQFLPIVSHDLSFDLDEVPANHKVLVYVDEKRPDFYGSHIIFRLAKEFSEIDFVIIGSDGKNMPDYANLVYKGWVYPAEMERMYREISILLRIPTHDGLSMMILEALAKGKEVIYKYNFPYCRKARNFDEAKNALKEILKSPRRVNYDGHKYILQKFSKEKIASKLVQFFNDITGRRI